MEFIQNCRFHNAIPPAVIKDNAAFTAVGVNTAGYRYATFIFTFGATDIAMALLNIGEADADTGYSIISGLNWGTSPASLPSDTADNAIIVVCIDMTNGRKQWLKPAATAGDGTAGTYLSCVCILSDAVVSPTTATQRNTLATIGFVVI